MKTGRILVLGCVTLALSLSATAQSRKDYSPQYLRAAIGSIRHRTPISVTGEYDAETGLKSMDGWLDDDPYSRFIVKDSKTGFEFKSMYCEHNSAVFKKLLATSGRKIFTFQGHKDTGDDQEDAFYATQLIFVEEIKPKPGEKPPGAAAGAALRVTITDAKTGNRTVLVNVVRGQAYVVDDLTVVVEDEPASAKP